MPYYRSYRTRAPYRRKPARRFVRSNRSTLARKPSRPTYTRRYRKRSLKVSTFRPKWTNPIRQTSLVKFRYEDTDFPITLTTLGGYYDFHVFSVNSVYDPDQTGVGVQPYGWDQYTPDLFDHYQVYASKITVNFVVSMEDDETQVQTPKIRCWLIPFRLNALGTADPADWAQLPFRKCIDFGTAEGSRSHRLTNYITMKQLYPDRPSNDADFTGAYNGNPACQAFWHVLFDTQTLSLERAVQFDVRITYYTRLTRESYTNES